MEDVPVSTDSPAPPKPTGAQPTATTPPKPHGPLDQAKDSARKVLAIITGRSSH